MLLRHRPSAEGYGNLIFQMTIGKEQFAGKTGKNDIGRVVGLVHNDTRSQSGGAIMRVFIAAVSPFLIWGAFSAGDAEGTPESEVPLTSKQSHHATAILNENDG